MKISGTHLFVILCCVLVLGGCKESSMRATKWLFAGPDEELIEALKQQVKRDSINRTPEEREARQKQQERNVEIEAIREAEIQHLRAEGGETADIYNDEIKTEDKWEMSYNQGLILVGLVLAGFLFLIWWFVIRKIRNKIRDMSYMQGEVASILDNVTKDPRFNNLSDEERESAEKMKAFLNRKNN